MIITRKIELKLINEEDFSKIKKWFNLMPKIYNEIIFNKVLNCAVKEKFIHHNNEYNEKIKNLDAKITNEYEKLKGEKDKNKRDSGIKIIEKLKKDKTNFNIKAKNDFDKLYKEAFSKNFTESSYKFIADNEIYKDVPKDLINYPHHLLKSYDKEIGKVRFGLERLKFYKKGTPIPIRSQKFNIKYSDDGLNFILKIFQGIQFTLHFGRDKSNNASIVKKVVDEVYKISDSSIQLKKGKIFLNLCFNIPQNENELIKGRVVGVDLGLAIPAYCAVNDNMDRLAIGSYDEFTRVRTQLNKRRESINASLVTAKGGHGRKRKLQAMKNLNGKERDWVKTYNHKVSKAIVQFAVKNKAEQINLEFLKGYGNKETKDFVLRNWSYYELQKFIEYKAEKEGIKVTYIDPYHTSQTCSICGHYEKGQRQSQAKFVCASCGEEINADFNAAKNIAKSDKYVTKTSDCQYHKKDGGID